MKSRPLQPTVKSPSRILEPPNPLQTDQVWVLRFWQLKDSLGDAVFSSDARQRIPAAPISPAFLSFPDFPQGPCCNWRSGARTRSVSGRAIRRHAPGLRCGLAGDSALPVIQAGPLGDRPHPWHARLARVRQSPASWFDRLGERVKVHVAAFLAAAGILSGPIAHGAVVFDTLSPYHRVQVIDQGGVRTLSFDGSQETRMSLQNPLQGHFQYTESFHLAWLWNTNLQRVLMIGLGGGSTQRSFLHYYPAVRIDSVEIDPVVVQVATNFFGVTLGDRHQVHVVDGRMFLRRTRERYDLIALDAYVKNRYGSQMPRHLVTREFMELARERLSTDGVLAYNLIGTLHGWQSDLLAALARTLQEVFPQVFCCPVGDSQNVVLFALQSPTQLPPPDLQRRATDLLQRRTVTLPGFMQHARVLQPPPATTARAPVLTDDRVPEGWLAR
jgi:spermidine synthase